MRGIFDWIEEGGGLLLAVIFVVGFIALDIFYPETKNEDHTHEVTISAYELEEYWLLEEKAFDLERENENLEEENDQMKRDLQDAKDLIYEYEDGYNFLMDNVVIASDDVYGPYHRYGCTEIDWSRYWVFNIEYAQYLGLSSCPYCM